MIEDVYHASATLLQIGLSQRNNALAMAGLSALYSISQDHDQFLVLVRQATNGHEIEAALALGKSLWAKAAGTVRGRIVDFKSEAHLVLLSDPKEGITCQIAELGIEGQGLTEGEARRACFSAATVALKRAWSSMRRHHDLRRAVIKPISFAATVLSDRKD